MAEWGPAYCGCGCRPEEATEPGCPCRQCQPGPGINFIRGLAKIAKRNAELMAADRYEDVCWVYIRRN